MLCNVQCQNFLFSCQTDNSVISNMQPACHEQSLGSQVNNGYSNSTYMIHQFCNEPKISPFMTCAPISHELYYPFETFKIITLAPQTPHCVSLLIRWIFQLNENLSKLGLVLYTEGKMQTSNPVMNTKPITVPTNSFCCLLFMINSSIIALFLQEHTFAASADLILYYYS